MASWAPSGPYAWASNPAPAAAPSNWWDGVNNGLGNNSGLLLGLGSSLLSGNLGSIGQNVAQGAASDRSRRLQDTALGLQIKQRNATADWARKNGHPEWADAIESGAISGSDVFNQMNKLTVLPFGSEAINGSNQVVGGNSANGGFGGTDLKSQAWNTIMTANAPGADPALKADPKFAAAWAIATEPTMTPQGMMQPQVPPSWGPGQSAGAAPTPYLPAQAGGPTMAAAGLQQQPYPNADAPLPPGGLPPGTFQNIAPPTQVANLPNVIPGTAPYNESKARLGDLTSSAIPDLKRVVDNFGALQNTWGQLLDKDPTGLTNGLKPEDYQRASGATKAALGNVMYFVSGAAQGYTELSRKLDTYLPAFGDHSGTVVDKLDRFANDIMSMANASGDPRQIERAQQAIANIQDTEQQILARGARKASKPAPPVGTVEGGYMFKGGDPGDQKNWTPST